MRFGQCLDIDLRQAPAANQSFIDQAPHGRGHFLKRDFFVDAVQIVEIDVVGRQTFHGGDEMGLDGIVDARTRRHFIRPQMQFCGKHNVFAYGGKSFADELFIVARVKHHVAVDFGGVKEIAAGIKGLAHRVDAVFSLGHFAVAVRKTHAAHADGGDFQIAKFSFLHLCLPCSCSFNTHSRASEKRVIRCD